MEIASNEKNRKAVPACNPEVMTTFKAFDMEKEGIDAIDDDDVHVVLTLSVEPTRSFCEYEVDP